MATCTFFDCFFEDSMEEVHNFASDTLAIILTNSAPTAATDDERADITQIANGNGYLTNGQTLDSVTSTQTSGTFTLGASNEVFTASGGTMATFRYAVLVNNSAANQELICYWDQGSTISLADGESCTITFAGGAVFTFTTDA
ncbi:MAG: hypothetical protein GY847_28955 [Proteobacteria bacterium]|nr:hypothetical protein [Pseudomonadota bacterium]